MNEKVRQILSIVKPKMEYDQASIKQYDSKTFKLTVQHCVSNTERNTPQDRCTANDEKLACNLRRAKNRVFDLAMANDFEYFFTATLNPKKHNRQDLKAFSKNLGQFIRDYRKKHNANIEYIFIPEKHKDGINWHIHGLIKGIKKEHLSINKNGYLHWEEYSKKFGWCSIDKIKNKKACSAYLTKYVVKSLNSRTDELNQKLYYTSRHLKEPQIIKKGTLSFEFMKAYQELNIWSYQNEYCSVLWLDHHMVKGFIEHIKENQYTTIKEPCRLLKEEMQFIRDNDLILIKEKPPKFTLQG